MSRSATFLKGLAGKDSQWLRAEVIKRDAELRSLKFELGFGKVDALTRLRSAKRERAQLLTALGQTQRSQVKEPSHG